MTALKGSLISILAFLLLSLPGATQPSQGHDTADTLVIDERDQKVSVEKIIKIDQVWAGHPVGFSLLTDDDQQYIAYYNDERHLIVGQRHLHQDTFALHKIPPYPRESREGTSTILGWDSHNYLTLGLDKEGYIHLSGNMHVNGLTYFRSTVPNDITTLIQVDKMVGSEENRCTYPVFMNTAENELIFRYRDGGSGNGNDIYNRYDSNTQQWTRLVDTPLTDGQDSVNAYSSRPNLLEDGWYHMYWVWRDTPDCSTNHDLSYIKSPDMVNWYNALGQPIELPVTVDNKSVVVDPIPIQGGIINLAAKLCLDKNNKPIFAYHKYDSAGNLQFYTAQLISEVWQIKQVTNWDYRWYFSGYGSINKEVFIGPFNRREDGFYELGYSHIKYGDGTLLLDENLDLCGEVLKPQAFTATMEVEGDFPGLTIQTASDQKKDTDKQLQYVLKWETLPRNRDKPRPKPWPEPSQLYLYELRGSPDN
ncbi:MAG: BNR repeat-containing protein [Bacteroidota bacterium]